MKFLLFVWCLCLQVNVADYRDGVSIDDTAAIQAAADRAAQLTYARKPEGGSYLGASAALYFPAGRYVISDEIKLGPYSNVISDGRAVIEQRTPDKRCFVFDGAYTVSVQGLRFVGGRNQLWFGNRNVDSTILTVQDCEFQLSTDYAIDTQCTAPAFRHMSALLTVERCKFIRPRKVLRNVCDYATVRNTWVTIGASNFDRDSAAFLNASGTLMLDTMIGVPVFGSIDERGRQTLDNQGVDLVRWIDNYGSLLVDKSRFGGEFGGIPILRTYGFPNVAYPYLGQTVAIERSQICAGPASRPDSAVLTLYGCPQLMTLTGNYGLADAPLIKLQDGLAIPSSLKSRVQFVIGPNSTHPVNRTVPAEVRQFLK